jgi:hypothetical protein
MSNVKTMVAMTRAYSSFQTRSTNNVKMMRGVYLSRRQKEAACMILLESKKHKFCTVSRYIGSVVPVPDQHTQCCICTRSTSICSSTRCGLKIRSYEYSSRSMTTALEATSPFASLRKTNKNNNNNNINHRSTESESKSVTTSSIASFTTPPISPQIYRSDPARKINEDGSSHLLMMYESILELYDILVRSKPIGTFRYPIDYRVYAYKVIRYAIQIDTQFLYGKDNNNNNNNNKGNHNNNFIRTDGTKNTPSLQLRQQPQQLQQEQQVQLRVAIMHGINMALQLWERTVQEYSLRCNQIGDEMVGTIVDDNHNHVNQNQQQQQYQQTTGIHTEPSSLWFYDSKLLHRLLLKWKLVALACINPKVQHQISKTYDSTTILGASIMSPIQVLEIVKNISHHCRDSTEHPHNDNNILHVPINSYNIILQVLVTQYQKESYFAAPLHIEQFLQSQFPTMVPVRIVQRRHQQEQEQQRPVVIKPNLFTYTIILRTWIQSQHPWSLPKVQSLMATIQKLYKSKRQADMVGDEENQTTDPDDCKSIGSRNESGQQDMISSHIMAIRYYASLGMIQDVENLYQDLQTCIDDLSAHDQYPMILLELIHAYCTCCCSTTAREVPSRSAQQALLTGAEKSFHELLTHSVLDQSYVAATNAIRLKQENAKATMTGALYLLYAYRASLRPVEKQVIHVQTHNKSKDQRRNDDIAIRAEKVLQQLKEHFYEDLETDKEFGM